MKHRRLMVIAMLCLPAVGMSAVLSKSTSGVALVGRVLNTFRSAYNPTGTLALERRAGVSAVVVSATHPAAAETEPDAGWSSYNRTLTSQRYSPLTQINTTSVRALKELCSYDTRLRESFETSPILVGGALIGTTAFDVFSIDATTCRENWRTHEDVTATGPFRVNRGVAYLDGRVFRGSMDGRMLAYDVKTGRRLWATKISDTSGPVDAAPIAWHGLVFVGNAGGDAKGVKGRMYALSAETGKIVWETYLVPRAPGDPIRGAQGSLPQTEISTWGNTPDVPISGGATWTSYTLDPETGRLFVPVGNPSPDFVRELRRGTNLYTNSVVALDAKTGDYVTHFPAAPGGDWHDWDVSNAPAIIKTRGGRKIVSFAPKNGHLYGFDLATSKLLYRTPVTRVENVDVPLSTKGAIHFCPGAVGGGEWNGVAYDPRTNLILSGETEWCATVKLAPEEETKAARRGALWMGHEQDSLLDVFGAQDPHTRWAGWLYATDADTGEWIWRLKSNYPIVGGVTTTGGGLVFFGDVGGNLYAVDIVNGQRLWHQKLDGGIGGGVTTYQAQGSQKLAVAGGLTSILWPTKQSTAKIVIFGLGERAK